MGERRFNDDEVAAIFERAAKAHSGQQRITSSAGMTLAELQQIGSEAGIAADAIREAALVVGQTGQPVSRNFFGLPLGVGRTIELERKLTDDEWEQLVVDLRETFDARGTVKAEGSLRQWTNGNLQALLEPTATGQRVRLRTMRAQARNAMLSGVAMLGVAGVGVAATVLNGGGGFAPMLPIAAAGIAMFALGAFQVPGWAKLRRQQMDEIASRLIGRISK